MESQFQTNVKWLTTLKLTVDNLTPLKGLYISCFWFGLHDGNFDIFDLFKNPSLGFKAISKDNKIIVLTKKFATSSASLFQGVIVSPFSELNKNKSDKTVSSIFPVNRKFDRPIYLSYAVKLITNQEIFIANTNRLAYPIFDKKGNFLGADFTISNSEVIDNTGGKDEFLGRLTEEDLPEIPILSGQNYKIARIKLGSLNPHT